MGSRNPLKNAKIRPKRGSRFAYDGLDRVIHERARLSVLTSLISHTKGLPFGELKQLCGLTDGNLNRHLMVLEDAKMVATIKGVEHGRPQTVCRITPLGRKRYIDYLAVLEQVVLDASSAIKADTLPRGGHNPANA
jgi:DNA-binding transcriptional ArsR family regulator